jgi:hypothetical protein
VRSGREYPLLEQDAETVHQGKKTVIWFVWFVLFIWLNQTNQIDQMNQINQINKTNQIDQINQTNRAYPTRVDHRRSRVPLWFFRILLGRALLAE